MSGAAATPFARYSRLVTTRLRSQVHAQSLANTVLESDRRRFSPAGKAAMTAITELVAIKQKHRRGFDPTLKARAVAKLAAMPLLTAEEDPRLVGTLRALRVAAHFDAVHAPATLALLNHVTKHAYLLDGFGAHQLANILLELRHPRTAEALGILLPRLAQVAEGDVTAAEACAILEVLHTYNVGQATSSSSPSSSRSTPTLSAATATANGVLAMERIALVMQRTIKDLPLADVTRCVRALVYFPDRRHARAVLVAAEARLLALLSEGVASLQVYVADVFLNAAESDAVSSSSLTVATAQDGGEGTSEQQRQQQQHQQQKEGRVLLLSHARASRALMRALVRSSTAAGVAPPRRVMAELSRCYVAYSDPRPYRHNITNHNDDGDDGQQQGRVVFDEEEAELAQLWAAAPRATRRDISFFLHLLCASNYHHEGALLVLASRAATTGAGADDGGGGQRGAPVGSTGTSTYEAFDRRRQRQPTPTETLTDLTTAVESLAFFFATSAVGTVAALVQGAAAVRETGSSSGGGLAFSQPHDMLVAVDALSRLLLALARLRYPLAMTATGDEEGLGGRRQALEALMADDALAWFAGGPAAVKQPLLAAQLATGLAQLEGLTAAADASSSPSPSPPSPAREAGHRRLAQLLEAIRRSGIERTATTSSSSRAEAQQAVADAAAAVGALRSGNRRLASAVQDAEALAVKLL